MDRLVSWSIVAFCGIPLCGVAYHWFGWVGLGVALAGMAVNIILNRRLDRAEQREEFALALEREKQNREML
jgi:hypothetical protein